ncbi:tyrosine-type recombinase/integrase [Streptomyces sp. G-G2]|uniref:tyrosine-type recombinase/integrase n=1 Tax=Streptomyces sp. G-G2 TaxID=3046201 RepID=UPI0024B9F018|nr:tyrosine-type recombinase/integrase [Streptomyces sp. G-G2]MDJ0383257.1 tyrosine-type recombinase/integrase [Streptomyces sp. G-G2]
MFKGSTYKRCKCTEPKLDAAGQPIFTVNGDPATREMGSDCPNLKKKDHGSWYYYVNLSEFPGTGNRRPRKGGFLTSKAAAKAAQKLWDEASDGIDIESKETARQFLLRWHETRVDLKESTRDDHHDFIHRLYIPAFGDVPMRDLRTKHIQAMFKEIWAFNQVKEANRVAAVLAKAEADEAHLAWKQAPKPRPQRLRERWTAARAALKEAYAKPRQDTGPGRQEKFLQALSGAMAFAVREKLITENWCDAVVIPKYEKPDPLVWTPERVARWRETGEIPGPVMVWTPELTGEFLDLAVEHSMYVMWHWMTFRGPRRGEATGLPWTEVDLDQGYANLVETLAVRSSYETYAETPKSRASRRTVTFDSITLTLLAAWREVQKGQRERWELKRAQWKANNPDKPQKYGPFINSGKVFTMEDGRPWNPKHVSQTFDRFLERHDLPPIRLHDLRHCAASLSLIAGLSMKAIQLLLGHASFSLTADTYTSLMPQFDKANADATVAVVPRTQAQASTTPGGGQAQPEAPPEPEATPDPAPRLVLISSSSDAEGQEIAA